MLSTCNVPAVVLGPRDAVLDKPDRDAGGLWVYVLGRNRGLARRA